MLDKKALSEARQRAGLSKAAEDAFLDVIRADAARLVRLRHPGWFTWSRRWMRVRMPWLWSPSRCLRPWQMRLGMWRIFPRSLRNSKECKSSAVHDFHQKVSMIDYFLLQDMGLLEVKHGLLQIAETLDFLHNNARLIHRAIAPESVLITSNGAWKLSGFGFAISTDQSSNDSAGMQAFHYAEYDVEDSILPLQPSINYTAPELVRSKTSSVGSASDVFSLACLAYHLIARKPLFDCHNNVKMYMNSLTYLTSEAFSAIPRELIPDLQSMLSANEALRPTAIDFTGSSFFREDTRLRALRFLDHMLERDNMQKSEFLKALSDMWKDFDPRVLRFKVLPPLCAELRNLVMQPIILPMVLTIAESQDKSDFELSTLPALVPVLNSAAGETLLLLVKHAELIINKASQEHLISHVLPMLVRAYDDTDARVQEEVLKRTILLARQLDKQLVKQIVLPRVHGLALKTTVAAVRVNALLCFSEMVHILDKSAVLDILQTIQRCTAVDHSAPTLMCTLGVANSILKQFGIEFVVEHVLPLLLPLLITQQLNVQQFAKYMLFIKDVLRKIEEKRGVTLTESGIPEVKPSQAADGYTLGQTNKTASTAPSITKRSSSWDEDWIPARPASTVPPSLAAISAAQPAVPSQPARGISTYSTSSTASVASTEQLPSSCPAVDVEWPPQSSSGVATQFGDFKNLNGNKGTSDSSLDDIDPFANWPPRRSGAPSVSTSLNNGTTASSAKKNGISNMGTPPNGLSFQSESWHLACKLLQNLGTSALGFSTEKAADLESIFAPNKNEHTALRLAPPPTNAVGRVRTRGRGSQGQTGPSSPSGRMKSQTQQTPLLDLL
ncbi:UNVERIFIED_CONTAM: hypothetical protein Scaly_1513900 [Sesamum calycinum]|uniref:Protein kinase domain-containing protein n=1 Tax=Sesamum calycinum TaxID=2727403 RepID=A0AAW2P888_9LAMI